MTISELEIRIKELEDELNSLGEDIKDATSYVSGVDGRRMRLEMELAELKEELQRLKTASDI